MTKRTVGLGLIAAAMIFGTQLQAQVGVRVRLVTESYTFDPGLALTDVKETTIPVSVSLGLGRFGSLAIGTGYVTVDVSGTGINKQTISTLLDTQFRLTYNLLPGKLMLLFSGVLPSGTKTVALEELSVLGAISSDVIGFSSSTVGSGGSLGGGFAGAIPLGSNFAVGVGASFKKALSYQPVSGRAGDLLPGAEIRARFGIQGSLARRTYVRLTAVYATRGRDDFDNLTRSGVGDRVIGYASVNQGFGRSSLTLYSFVVDRGDPKLTSDPNLPALPQGRLTAFGTRLDLRFGGSLVVAPRIEIRNSKEEINSTLEKIGSSTRIGADITLPIGRSASLVFQGSIVSGEVVQAGNDIGFDGTRFGVYLDWHPR
jgi:hypothetical protein